MGDLEVKGNLEDEYDLEIEGEGVLKGVGNLEITLDLEDE